MTAALAFPTPRSEEMPMEALLRALDVAGIGYCVTDETGRVMIASPVFAAILDMTPEEAVDAGPWFRLDAATEGEKDEREALWRAFLETTEPWRGWVHFLPRGGGERYFDGTAMVLGDGRVLMIGNDRTDQCEADRAIERAEDTQRHVLDDLPISVSLQARDGQILYVNRFVPDRMRVPVSDLIGRYPGDLPFVGLDASVLEVVGEAREKGERLDGVPVAVTEGQLAGTHWLLYARPLFDRSRAFVQFLTIAVDRTADEALGKEREAFARALAETQKISALNDFAGSLAHELSNILHPVGVYGRALAQDPDHPDRRVFAERIRSAAMTAGRILRRTLSMARTEAGAAGRHDVGRLVEEVLSSARDLAPGGLAYALTLPDAPLWGLFSPTELRQVLLNLLNNAAEAQRHVGTVSVTVSEGRPAPDGLSVLPTAGGDFVSIAVRDEGGGMTPETRARIFEPFFTTKKGSRGTGLGLPVVQGLVTGWGGVVSVETAPGRGSTFTVWIPSPPALAG